MGYQQNTSNQNGILNFLNIFHNQGANLGEHNYENDNDQGGNNSKWRTKRNRPAPRPPKTTNVTFIINLNWKLPTNLKSLNIINTFKINLIFMII